MADMHSSTATKAREDRAIYRALVILKNRMREHDTVISSPDAARDYLRLLLADETREVFTVLYLDAQNRLIEAETPFYGTLTQTSVYPREVVRRALHHNAASVMFAHNHPSGRADPSQADMVLTCRLKDALALVDVQTLDHFIVAGFGIFSFAEQGILGVRDLPQNKTVVTPTKHRGRPRKEKTATTA